jgi:hypothetical protein
MLSQLVRPLFEGGPFLFFPTLALGIFVAVFLAVAVRVLLRRASTFDSEAKLPLDDSEVGNHER